MDSRSVFQVLSMHRLLKLHFEIVENKYLPMNMFLERYFPDGMFANRLETLLAVSAEDRSSARTRS